MLIENTLFGTVDKVQEAIDLLREHEPPEGYYMAFSGGKDSVVAYELCKQAGVKVDAHYCLTTVDPPEVVYFVREHYPEAWEAREKPKRSMWQEIERQGLLPTRLMRYCCRIFKEQNGKGRNVITGIRAEESPRRAKRKKKEQKKGEEPHFFLHPIFDWTEQDVWEYINKNDLPYCDLYKEGFKRIGCVLCPFMGRSQTIMELSRFPKYAENYAKAADRAIQRKKADGKKIDWKNGKEMFDWWIGARYKTRIAESCDSIPLFSEDDGSIL